MTRAVIREELRIACEEISDIALRLFGEDADKELSKIIKREWHNAIVGPGEAAYIVRTSLWSRVDGKNSGGMLNANFPEGGHLDTDTGTIVRGWRAAFDVAEGVVSKFFGIDVPDASSDRMVESAKSVRNNLYRNKHASITANFAFEYRGRQFGVVTTISRLTGE